MLLNQLKVPFAWISGQMANLANFHVLGLKDHSSDGSIKNVTLDKPSQHLSVSDIVLLISVPVYCLALPPEIQALWLQGPTYLLTCPTT